MWGKLTWFSSSGVWGGQLSRVLGGQVGAPDLQPPQDSCGKVPLHPAAGEHVLNGHHGDVGVLCNRWGHLPLLTFHDAFCLFFPWMIIDIRFLSASRKCVIKLSHRIHRVLPGNNVGDRGTLQSLHFFLNSTARFHAKLLQMFVR